jgi:hypothetical protein
MRFLQYAGLVGLLLTAGCALRPRYGDFVNAKTEGKEVSFVVIDADSGKPVPGAKVEVSELKNRVQVTTGADGVFKLPVEKKYLDENPLFVVTLPKDVVHYRVELVKPAPVAPTPAPVEVPAPAPVEAADAGVSNG